MTNKISRDTIGDITRRAAAKMGGRVQVPEENNIPGRPPEKPFRQDFKKETEGKI
jgi:hypothetical protein